jgi:inosose dehydratase
MATRCSFEISKSGFSISYSSPPLLVGEGAGLPAGRQGVRPEIGRNIMHTSTRRKFLKTMGAGAIAGSVSAKFTTEAESLMMGSAHELPFDLGIASYTFHMFPLDKVIEMTSRLGVRKLTLKDMHLPLYSSEADIRSIHEKISAAGLVLASVGVVYMKTEEEIRNAFACARMADLKFIVGVPEQGLLAVAEKYVKETGIALAIHNHGPTDERFPSPESVYARIAAMDKRMGLCIDIGHTQRLGLDPSVEFERFADRILDVHIKDVSSADASGTTVEIGRGVIDMPRFLGTLKRLRYLGTLHFEFEKDEKDPLPGLAESVGYVRGVLAAMGPHEYKEKR